MFGESAAYSTESAAYFTETVAYFTESAAYQVLPWQRMHVEDYYATVMCSHVKVFTQHCLATM